MRIFWCLLLIGLTFFLIHEAVIAIDGLVDAQNEKSEVAVIFGSKVNRDGNVSHWLEARLVKGLELYSNGWVDKIYVSGGLGQEGHFEGTVMKAYLVEQGVPSQHVIADDLGVNTRATALNFVNDLSTPTSAILVTQYFHVSRVKLAFKQVGVGKVAAVHCDFHELRDFYSLFREFFGFYKYLVLY